MALELCTFDMLPPEYPGFLRGFSAALFATSLCYPLDTMRYAPSHLQSTVLTKLASVVFSGRFALHAQLSADLAGTATSAASCDAYKLDD